jgi:hypothetical protein
MLSALCRENTESLIGIHLSVILMVTCSSNHYLPGWIDLVNDKTLGILRLTQILRSRTCILITHFLNMTYVSAILISINWAFFLKLPLIVGCLYFDNILWLIFHKRLIVYRLEARCTLSRRRVMYPCGVLVTARHHLGVMLLLLYLLERIIKLIFFDNKFSISSLFQIIIIISY